MKIIIAPDSFKESLSSVAVANAIYQGFAEAYPKATYELLPMADGGEGTLEALSHALPLKFYTVTVSGPLFEPRYAKFGLLEEGQLAVIEIAQASGLSMVPMKYRNPLNTTTYGTGELILQALDKGCRRFIICLGGSASCDLGIGALTALGLQFKDENNNTLKPIGGNLAKIVSIDVSGLDPRLAECEFMLAYDVDNFLLGSAGALMYAPQKGALAEDLTLLQEGLEHCTELMETEGGKKLSTLIGGGAAGGLSAGLFAFLNARLFSGATLIMNLVGLEKKIRQADLIITGEGQLDSQTLHGKAPIAIAKLAKRDNIPVIVFAAQITGDLDELYKQGILAAFSIAPGPITKEYSIDSANKLLWKSAHNVARMLMLRMNDR